MNPTTDSLSCSLGLCKESKAKKAIDFLGSLADNKKPTLDGYTAAYWKKINQAAQQDPSDSEEEEEEEQHKKQEQLEKKEQCEEEENNSLGAFLRAYLSRSRATEDEGEDEDYDLECCICGRSLTAKREGKYVYCMIHSKE